MKLFYGWLVLLGLFLVYMVTNGILLNTLPLFYPELMNEFGWNEAQVTAPFSLFFTLTALLSPMSGALADRYNPRWLMLGGVTIIVSTLALYPLIDGDITIDLPMLGSTTVTPLTQLTLVYLAFALGLSFSGMVTSMIMLTRWFHRWRGRAVGIFLMASSFGGAVFPLIARETLATEGWREALWLLGGLGAILTIVPVLLLVRSHPHEKGLHADGADQDPPDAAEPSERPRILATFKSLLRTPIFYLIAFVTATLWFCFVGVLQHQFIFFGRDLQIDSATLPLITSVFFWAAIAGKVMFGFLADRFQVTWIMFLAVVSLVVGFAMLLGLAVRGPTDSLIGVFAYAVVFGAGYSGTFTMIQLLIAHRYAGPSYGSILGVFTLVDTVGATLGTQALGWLAVAFGGYTAGFAVMLALCIIAGLCVLVLRAQERNAVAEPVSASV